MFAARFVLVTGAALLAAGGAMPSFADGGEITVIRDVPPRMAARPAAPGPIRAKTDAGPDEEVRSVLGLDRSQGGIAVRELSDAEFAEVTRGAPTGASAGRRVTQTLGAGAHSSGPSGRATHGLLAGSAGGGGTRGVGPAVKQGTDQLRNALTGMRFR